MFNLPIGSTLLTELSTSVKKFSLSHGYVGFYL